MQALKHRQSVNGGNRYTYSALIGIVIGIGAGAIGLVIAIAGPVVAIGAALGILAGLYILSNVSAALYGVVLVAALLPFGTLPFKVAITPTLLDMALGAFLLVYLAQWMTGRRQGFRLTPVHALVGLYALWLLLAFALGLRYAAPTSANLRQFAETLMSIGLVFILVDLIREPQALRRLVLVVMIGVGIQAGCRSSCRTWTTCESCCAGSGRAGRRRTSSAEWGARSRRPRVLRKFRCAQVQAARQLVACRRRSSRTSSTARWAIVRADFRPA